MANEGTIALNKASSIGVHATRAVEIDSGVTVQFTGTGDYQIDPNSPGDWIHLDGGTLDFNGRNQHGTTFWVQTAGSTIANNAPNTTSVYTPNDGPTWVWADYDFTASATWNSPVDSPAITMSC